MPRAKTTPKSQQTRSHILDTAKRLFRDHGFQATTLRQIAAEADVALGLSYRYFPQKEDFALALYLELAQQLVDATRKLPPASLAEGFAAVMKKKLALLEPHREALAALFAASLTASASRPASATRSASASALRSASASESGPVSASRLASASQSRSASASESESVSVVGAASSPVRALVRSVFERVVAQATDLPALDDDERAALVSLLYGAHLLLVLAWLVDRRDERRGQRRSDRRGVGSATSQLVKASNDMLARAVPFLALPPVRAALVPVAQSLDAFLEAPS